MRHFLQKIARFLAKEDGPTAVEYAIMLMLVILMCISAVTLIGQTTSTSIQHTNDAIEEAIGER
jgi:pilus assembly protein Flp/PilA